MLTTRPRGTADITPGEIQKWRYVEGEFYRICRAFGYAEIRTPVFEHTELFVRGVGDTTDIVEKEMYTFVDRGGRSITLRPENTAPAVRAYLENGLYNAPKPVKLFYIGPMFRYDRPQAGRLRQFHQAGVEVFGSYDPAVDAETAAMAVGYLEGLGLKNLELHINSVGCSSCRPVLRQKLKEFFASYSGELCEHCRQRLSKNPLRVLDCKNESCREAAALAPVTHDYLCGDCSRHFDRVKEYLKRAGVEFTVNPRLVRGLDYYTHTAFEITAPGIGAQSSVGGGGRYNGLVEACGGPPTPGVGFAVGLERVILALDQQGIVLPDEGGLEVFVVSAGEKTSEEAFALLQEIRRKGISADKDYMGRSVKAQMKQAARSKAFYAVIAGEEELKAGCVVIKDMASGEQKTVKRERAADCLFNLLSTGGRR